MPANEPPGPRRRENPPPTGRPRTLLLDDAPGARIGLGPGLGVVGLQGSGRSCARGTLGRRTSRRVRHTIRSGSPDSSKALLDHARLGERLDDDVLRQVLALMQVEGVPVGVLCVPRPAGGRGRLPMRRSPCRGRRSAIYARTSLCVKPTSPARGLGGCLHFRIDDRPGQRPQVTRETLARTTRDRGSSRRGSPRVGDLCARPGADSVAPVRA